MPPTYCALCYTGVRLLIVFLKMANVKQSGLLGNDRTVPNACTLSVKERQPQLFSRGAPGVEDIERDNIRNHCIPKPTLLLATPQQEGGDHERDCGKCVESGSSSILVINSNVFGDPSCPQKTQAGSSVVHKAIKEGDLDSIKYYHNTTPGILDCVDHLGRNAFHLACWYGQFLVTIFLSNVLGVNVDATDNNGWSALHYACDCIHPQLAIVKHLVEKLYLNPRQENENGNVPIVLAKHRRHTGIIKYLVDAMKQLKPTDPKDQRPVLFVRDRDNDNSYPSLQHAEHPNGDRNMSKLENRLFTFTMGPGSWPRAHPTERKLAEQGFIYLGVEERVMCFCCKALVHYWDDGVDPLIKHYRKNSSCQFLLGNFRIQLDRLLSQQRIQHFNPRYSNNSARLHSFQDWTYSSIVSSYKLASVGFYCLGRGSKVQCFSCGLIHERWLRGDIPMEVHKRLNPTCPFIRSLKPQVPVSPLPSNTLEHSAQSIPTTIQKPNYDNVEIRLKSFKLLSKDFPISPQDCADAGLFFIRKPDVMQCFKCDVIVSGWVAGDVAVEKHREVSPECKFLREFFPTKLDLKDKEYDSATTIDPSTLPEPLFTREDLEQMATKDHDAYDPIPGMSNISLAHSDHTPSYSYSHQPVLPTYNRPQTRLLSMHERYSLPEYSQTSSESSGYASAYPSITPPDKTTAREELSDKTQLQRRYFQEGYDILTTRSRLVTPTQRTNRSTYQPPTFNLLSSHQQSSKRTVSYLMLALIVNLFLYTHNN